MTVGTLAAGALAFAMLAAAPALSESMLRPVHFTAGQSSITLDGAVVRGDSDVWSFAANGGQTATIAVTSLEDNAAFAIFEPPASVTHSDDGLDVDGTMLGADIKQWQGKLPASGEYYVQVSGDRGNATYKLTISIE
jgi:hypothetical protein